MNYQPQGQRKLTTAERRATVRESLSIIHYILNAFLKRVKFRVETVIVRKVTCNISLFSPLNSYVN